MELAHVTATPSTTGLSVVVTSVASDSHTWNLIFLQLLLEELGHRVTNLGACVPDQLMVERCREMRPDLIVISSVNGHGATDGGRVVGRLRECPELRTTPIVIGGKLGIAGAGNQRLLGRLREAGFDAVFDDSAGLGSFHTFVGALSEVTGPTPGAALRPAAVRSAGAARVVEAVA
ncbi:methylaspartate mutase sigma subunit [Streptacidiphilus sp. MAP12-16]|uniref:cobalamin B12-binding domain-containing protein n=1 Tax=Streptacidiphilus sp. MAP12-16 TaxID=3156300 RepID=UPI003519632F